MYSSGLLFLNPALAIAGVREEANWGMSFWSNVRPAFKDP